MSSKRSSRGIIHQKDQWNVSHSSQKVRLMVN
ncbi:hypothetical protein T11_3518 [Trichinella zimbabwensis]|nr:hypothetical protein T11_3518 [Trichinella zimbabwensis]